MPGVEGRTQGRDQANVGGTQRVRVHFVGIGGYGMSGLAEVLQARGVAVSGCDARGNRRTERLGSLGIPVAIGHDASHVAGQDRVVYSTDVPLDLPELAAAREAGVAVVHRSEVLAEVLAQGTDRVVVTGTHGKTTTTTLITHLLAAGGLDPLGIVGGEVDAWGGGVRLGRGRVVVAEGDESDGSFLRYHPSVAVVTNVEREHLEHYGGDFARVLEAYGQFLAQVVPGGTAVLWQGDPRLMALVPQVPATATVHTYGEEPDAGMRARDVTPAPDGLAFVVERAGTALGRVTVPLHGRHNVRNTLAALDVALTLGVPWPPLVRALTAFANAHRRFEVVARTGGVTVIDDYAHHPTEIRAVLAAARELGPRRVVAVFQPQRYVRTRNLWQDFLSAFDGADAVILTEIYAPPGEAPLPGVSGAALCREIARRHPRCRFGPSLDDATDLAWEELREGDLLVTMGAGDVYRVAEQVRRRLRAGERPGEGA